MVQLGIHYKDVKREVDALSTCRVLWSIPDCMHNLSNGKVRKEKERGREGERKRGGKRDKGGRWKAPNKKADKESVNSAASLTFMSLMLCMYKFCLRTTISLYKRNQQDIFQHKRHTRTALTCLLSRTESTVSG